MAFKVLLVEDDAQLIEIVSDYFTEKSGGTLQIDTATTGSEGRDKCLENDFDLVLLDVMLPEVDGFAICRELRKKSDVPIIFITARHERMTIVRVSSRCDDYVAKPFAGRALCQGYSFNQTFQRDGKKRNNDSGQHKLNPYRCTVYVNESEVILAPMEFAILKILMENRGRLVSRESLIIRVWGYDFEGNDRVVDNHVRKLRKALGDASTQIKTVYKKGYKLEEKI